MSLIFPVGLSNLPFKPDPKCGEWQKELERLKTEKNAAKRTFENLEDKYFSAKESDALFSRGKTSIESMSTRELRHATDAAENISKRYDERLNDLSQKIDDKCKGPPSSPPLTVPVKTKEKSETRQFKLPGFEFGLTHAAKTLALSAVLAGGIIAARRLRLPVLRSALAAGALLLTGAALYLKSSWLFKA